jgi:hypothetical protein
MEVEYALTKMCRVIQTIIYNFTSAFTQELRHIDQSQTFK